MKNNRFPIRCPICDKQMRWHPHVDIAYCRTLDCRQYDKPMRVTRAPSGLHNRRHPTAGSVARTPIASD